MIAPEVGPALPRAFNIARKQLNITVIENSVFQYQINSPAIIDNTPLV